LHTQHNGDMIDDTKILEQTRLFAGIAPHDIESMLCCLHTCQMKYEKNEMILWEGDTISDIGIVLSGHGRSIKDDITGKTVIITLLEKGSYIGVLLAASGERKSPVSVQAIDHIDVLFISFDSILKRCPKVCPKHDRLLQNVFNCIAEKALVLHDRNDCLIKQTVREKVLTYLTREAEKQNRHAFFIHLNRNAMAEYLDVDRSALSRELSWMKRDGLIDYEKNWFELRL